MHLWSDANQMSAVTAPEARQLSSWWRMVGVGVGTGGAGRAYLHVQVLQPHLPRILGGGAGHVRRVSGRRRQRLHGGAPPRRRLRRGGPLLHVRVPLAHRRPGAAQIRHLCAYHAVWSQAWEDTPTSSEWTALQNTSTAGLRSSRTGFCALAQFGQEMALRQCRMTLRKQRPFARMLTFTTQPHGQKVQQRMCLGSFSPEVVT